jgi:hypothetical protein
MQIVRGSLRRIMLLPTAAGLAFAPRAAIRGLEQGACPQPQCGGHAPDPAARRDGCR